METGRKKETGKTKEKLAKRYRHRDEGERLGESLWRDKEKWRSS